MSTINAPGRGSRLERTHTPPASLADAIRRREEQTTAIIEIEGQLGRRNRTDPATGRRMAPEAYGEWRDRALEARTVKTNEVRLLKSWIADERRRLAEADEQVEDLRSILTFARNERRNAAEIAEELDGVVGDITKGRTDGREADVRRAVYLAIALAVREGKI